jgi:uncharacterized protein YeaO (DUF488 family)
MKAIFLKRIYDPYDEADGFRILIDRLWPRGVSKENAKLDLWLKEVSPSPDLRKEFAHMPERFEEFQAAYTEELQHNPERSEAVDQIIELTATRNVTLLYGAKDPIYNHARVLQKEINRRTEKQP